MKKLLLICGLCTLVLAAYVQAQSRGGRGQQGGMGGGMLSVEGDWAAICFELKVNDKTMMALLPVFQKAWDDRKALMEGMQSGQVDRMALMEEMKAIQAELEKGYEEILTREQKEHLTQIRGNRMGGGQRGGGGRRR